MAVKNYALNHRFNLASLGLRVFFVVALVFLVTLRTGTVASAQEGEWQWQNLIQISSHDESGIPIHGYRYQGTADHFYRGGRIAGEFTDGTYTCWHPDGWRAVDITWDDGVRVVLFDEEGKTIQTFETDGIGKGFFPGGQRAWEIRSGICRIWYPGGGLAVEVILAREIWSEWGVEMKPDNWVTYYASQAAEFYGGAVPIFAQGLTHRDPWVRTFAAQALGTSGVRGGWGLAALKAALSDPFWPVRREAARTVARLAIGDAVMVESLMTLARSDDEEESVRRSAIQALGALGHQAADSTDALMEILIRKRSPMTLRRAAATTLGEIGTEAHESVPALQISLNSGDGLLCVEALLALWKIDPGGVEVIPRLAEALKEATTRVAAAQAFEEIGPEARSALPKLSEALDTARSTWSYTEEEAYALAGAIHAIDPEAPAIATWTFGDGKEPVDRVGMPALFAMLMLQPEQDRTTSFIVELFGPDNAGREFEPYDYLEMIGPEAAPAIPGLIHLMGDNVIRLRDWVCHALGQIGTPALPALEKALFDDNYLRRWTAPRALGYIGKSAVPVLQKALGASEVTVRRRAVMALATIGPDAAAAIPLLEVLLVDRDDAVRDAAADALVRIRGAGTAADTTATTAAQPPQQTEAVGKAIDDALDWLARHQDFGGFWDADGFTTQCTGRRCRGKGIPLNDIGVTGLALQAFLSRGQPIDAGPYEDVISKGIQFLRDVQDPDSGLFGTRSGMHWVYNHAIAATALAEAYGQLESPALKPFAQRGLDLIHSIKNPGKAWRYCCGATDPVEQNDVSVTGWMVLALVTGERYGLQIHEHDLTDALRYIEDMTDLKTGRTGYKECGSYCAREAGDESIWPFEESEAMTALAMICRNLAGGVLGELEAQDRAQVAGSQLLRRKLPKWRDTQGCIDYYYWYFGTRAMRLYGGQDWEIWKSSTLSAVMQNQKTRGCAKGSWDPQMCPWGDNGGRIYATAMLTLLLETAEDG